MTALNKQAYRADGGDIGAGRLKEIADNAYGDEEKRWLAQRVLTLLDENLQLQRDKDSLEAVAIAMRNDMRGAREKQEAAEKRIAEHNFENRLLANADRDIKALRQRIAELEAREVAVKQFDDFQIVHYGGSEDYAKGYIDCQNNYNKALTAAGIGVKGE